MEQVYIFDFNDKIKAGYSTNVNKRLRAIELSCGVKATQVYSVEGGRKEEQLLHLWLKNRLEGEFFAFPFDDAKEILDKIKSGEITTSPCYSKLEYAHRYTFTAVITPGDGKYRVRIPDIAGCVTTGKDIEDAVAQITDALSGCLVVLEDQGLPIPAATAQKDIPRGAADVLTLISVDTIAYRAQTDTRAVRKNVSLPAWMATMAERRGINCSKVLQDALVQRLS